MKVFKINDYITKYSFGNLIETDTVVLKPLGELKENIKYFEFKKSTEFTYKMLEDDVVYGLGENMRGLNKRGWIYESFCTDEFSHGPNKKSLYASHNFLLIYGEKTFGVFIDYPGRVTFDVGFKSKDILNIKIEDENFDLYIIEGKSLEIIAKNFRRLIGKSYAPPKWAFGYQQSRWSYENEDVIRNVFNNFKDRDIPLDCICLDIDYMEKFKDFTISRERFLKFEKLVKDLKSEGVRLIPIIDAGVKIEEGYDLYEEGIKNNFFCLDENNKPFVAAVWPGKVHFPDFLNGEARKWFGSKYKFLIDKGIEGFWNDMNEPAIFYSEKRLKDAFETIKKGEDKNLDIYTFFDIRDTFPRLSNSLEDYKSFYHNLDGKLIRHDKVHNLYGYNMTKSAYEGFLDIDKNKRFLLFTRASHIGMHRYGGIWTGDNTSSFENLEVNIKMMANLNLCGFIYSGADTGGFGENVTDDLILRWFAFSMFTPLFRNHSSIGTRVQEPYSFEEEIEKALTNIIKLRYSLIHYIYSEFMKAIKNDELYFKPLTFEYKDKFLNSVEDQLLVGESIMVTPVYKQNQNGRYIYLPEEMLLWNVSEPKEFNYKILQKGHHYIDVKLNEVPIFLRKNKILVLGNPSKNIDLLQYEELNILAFLEDKAEYILYNDDGITKAYEKEEFSKLNIIIINENEEYKIKVNKSGKCLTKKLNFTIINKNEEKKLYIIYI